MNPTVEFSGLFEKALALYKTYFKQLIVFGIASAVLANLLNFIPLWRDNTGVVKPILSILLALIQMRIAVSLINYIKVLLEGDFMEPSTAFKEGKPYFWNYLITSLLLGVRVMLVLLPLFIIAMLFAHMIAYILVGLIGVFAVFYITIHYSFAPLMRVMNPEVATPFGSSYALVKSDRWEVLLFLIVLGLLSSGMIILNSFIPWPYPLGLLFDIIFTAVVSPLISILMVLFYLGLVDQQPAQEEAEIEG